jgi:hypothetical protein
MKSGPPATGMAQPFEPLRVSNNIFVTNTP